MWGLHTLDASHRVQGGWEAGCLSVKLLTILSTVSSELNYSQCHIIVLPSALEAFRKIWRHLQYMTHKSKGCWSSWKEGGKIMDSGGRFQEYKVSLKKSKTNLKAEQLKSLSLLREFKKMEQERKVHPVDIIRYMKSTSQVISKAFLNIRGGWALMKDWFVWGILVRRADIENYSIFSIIMWGGGVQVEACRKYKCLTMKLTVLAGDCTFFFCLRLN